MPRADRAADPIHQRERARLDPFEGIGRQVIRRRGELGLTQEELAERVGTSHSAISCLERGRHRASIATLESVGEALGRRLVVGLGPVTA